MTLTFDIETLLKITATPIAKERSMHTHPIAKETLRVKNDPDLAKVGKYMVLTQILHINVL